MGFSLSRQFECLLYSLVCGAALGAVYDLFRIVRMVRKNDKATVIVCDILFMVLAAFTTVMFCVGFSRGNTRLFVVAGELCGFAVYRLTIGRLSGLVFAPLISGFRNVFNLIIKCFLKIAKKLLKQAHKILYNSNRKRPRSPKQCKGRHCREG